MSQFEIYKQKSPLIFTRLVGVNYGTFSILLSKLEIALTDYLTEKPKRKCGVKSTLSLADQLLLSLLYMRNYETLLKVGSDFGISESYAQKRYSFIKMLLLRCLDLPDEQTLKDAISSNQVAVDVTEQPIERPVENQEDYYSGKKSYTP
jgi:Helix-turn-helix of DDE superfamily endonuclease